MENILFHLKAQQRFAELGLKVSESSIVPVRFHLHGSSGKLQSQFLAWEGEKENGVKRYISLNGEEIDRYSRELKDFQVTRLDKDDGFCLFNGDMLSLVIDNQYLRAFDFCKPKRQMFFEIERPHN